MRRQAQTTKEQENIRDTIARQQHHRNAQVQPDGTRRHHTLRSSINTPLQWLVRESSQRDDVWVHVIDGNQVSVYAIEEHILRQDRGSKKTGQSKDSSQNDNGAEQDALSAARQL